MIPGIKPALGGVCKQYIHQHLAFFHTFYINQILFILPSMLVHPNLSARSMISQIIIPKLFLGHLIPTTRTTTPPPLTHRNRTHASLQLKHTTTSSTFLPRLPTHPINLLKHAPLPRTPQHPDIQPQRRQRSHTAHQRKAKQRLVLPTYSNTGIRVPVRSRAYVR